jgi:hypothetical protein
MGSRSDNGGGWPSDGGSPDDLPDLPEEWGVIVIPDDLSELADEVAAVRAELQLTHSPTRWQRFARRPGVRRLHRMVMTGVRAPVLIISLAVLVTIASLFASAWPGPSRTPATQRTASTTEERESIPALELLGPDGAHVSLRGQLPAVVLLTDGCGCDQLIAETTTAVPPAVAVILVSSHPASPTAGGPPPTGATPQAQGKTVRSLRDPTDGLRKSLALADPDGTAVALLVDDAGEIIRTVQRTLTVEEFRADLARL